MTLQAPFQKMYCQRCGAEVIIRNKQTLDPFFGNEPHKGHCIYRSSKNDNPDLEPLLFDFLSKIPKPERKRRIIGAVGRAK